MKNIDWSKNRWDTVGENSILGVEPPRNRGKVRPTPGIAQKYKFEQENEALMKDLSEPTPQNNPQTTNNSASDEGGNSGDTLGAALAMLGAVLQTSKSIGKTHERNNENQTIGLAMLDEAQKEIEKLRQSLQGGREQPAFQSLKMRYEKPAPKPKWEVMDWGRNVWEGGKEEYQRNIELKSEDCTSSYYDFKGNLLQEGKGDCGCKKIVFSQKTIKKIQEGEDISKEMNIIDAPFPSEISIWSNLFKETEDQGWLKPTSTSEDRYLGQERSALILEHKTRYNIPVVLRHPNPLTATKVGEDGRLEIDEKPLFDRLTNILKNPNDDNNKAIASIITGNLLYEIHTHPIWYTSRRNSRGGSFQSAYTPSQEDIDGAKNLITSKPNIILGYNYTYDPNLGRALEKEPEKNKMVSFYTKEGIIGSIEFSVIAKITNVKKC